MEFSGSQNETVRFGYLRSPFGLDEPLGLDQRRAFGLDGFRPRAMLSRRPQRNSRPNLGLCYNFVVEAKVGLYDRKFTSLQRTDRE